METFNYLKSFLHASVIEKRKSEISGELEVCFQNGRFVLHSNDANYSYDTLHHVFQRGFKKLDIRRRKIRDVLILGFGAGSVASILTEELKLNVNLTAVELDPEVVLLGKKYFNTDRFTNLRLIIEDAEAFVEKHAYQYDLVVHDVFVNMNVPEKLTKSEYVDKLVRLTLPRGIGFYNFIVQDKDQWEQRIKLESHFASLGNVNLRNLSLSSVNRSLIWEKH